ncbi:MAG TPA: SDR family NAD(P)-dependent oxidoreductase [Nitrospiraceae bacterium]|nr:SDR family NAD(P)-dependent oxidoreductase [Nitrospiraceae bacterium]
MDQSPTGRSLNSKVALITGAGRGIGRATAELFAREGAKVVLCSRTKRQLAETMSSIASIGGEAVARVADIGIAREAEALVRLAVTHYGSLDILINNAGILGPRVSVIEYPHREWTQVLRINLNGTFFMSQAAAKVMALQGAGSIITVSSSVGRQGRGLWGAYAVSKFGVEGLSQVMADELQSAGVCVVTFNPGGTQTAMRAKAYPGEDPAAVRAPAEAARALVRLVANLSTDLSGQAFDLTNLP